LIALKRGWLCRPLFYLKLHFMRKFLLSLSKPLFKRLGFLSAVGLVVVFLSNVAYAQENLLENADYSKGLAAYLDEDYQSARAHWLNAAKQNDAKSMFNLGLLHERKLISNPEQQKADKWYRLAGKLGYGVADYHLALLLLSRGDTQQAQSLLVRSTNSGFALAKEQLEKMNVSVADLVNTVSTPTVASSRDSNGSYLTEDWISQRKPTSWTIQMLAFKDLNKVHDFIQQNKIQDKAAYFIETSGDGVYYKLIYGVYNTKQQANQARQSLSSDLKQFGPWLRTIASVQAVMASR